jgi:2',3'-cyclic-nucleotide 2'-phosphodiesterase (5'-nucleotidase family)
MRSTCKLFVASFFTVFCLLSCKTVYQPQAVKYADYRLTPNSLQDSTVIKLLQPYADSVNKSMNTVVAVAEVELVKKQPEGTLGNILADAMLAKATQRYKTAVDAAFINYGGIRLPSIAPGNITKGKIFELAPFDNIIVLQKVSGKILQELLNHISAKNGWPVAGINWQIKNKEAINVLVNGAPIDDMAVYTIALLDYVANGGDDCNMLRPIPQINSGYLFRDAVIDYFTDINKQGKKITAQNEKRISNAE